MCVNCALTLISVFKLNDALNMVFVLKCTKLVAVFIYLSVSLSIENETAVYAVVNNCSENKTENYLEVRGRYQNCSVLCCILKLCTVIGTLS